ncbi:hypothetical protein [Roseateles sp.]|uniref:hypothetical protein n=1 Tax=Roseateles sp. TaxID=1971397 RepID=UPI0039EA56C2
MKTAIILAALFAASSAFAQSTIDQTKALAGNVTPGDTPGFPVTISQPGSYKLTSNLTVPAGQSGIVIASSDVTLDLNGFSITGTGTCTVAGIGNIACNGVGSGVTVTGADLNRVAVRNGSVGGFGDCLRSAYHSRLSDLDLHHCDSGLYAPGGTHVARVSVYVSRYATTLYGVVADDLTITAASQAVVSSKSVLTRLNVQGAATGVSYYGNDTPSALHQSVLTNVTTPITSQVKSMGSNLCNGNVC